MALPDRPLSRKEEYLAKIANQAGAQKPDSPMSRTEEYLDYIAENGGGGGGKFVTLALEYDEDAGLLQTKKTVSEIIDLYKTGKSFGSVFFSGDDEDPVCLQIHYGLLAKDNNKYILSANFEGGESIVELSFEANSLSDVFSVPMS